MLDAFGREVGDKDALKEGMVRPTGPAKPFSGKRARDPVLDAMADLKGVFEKSIKEGRQETERIIEAIAGHSTRSMSRLFSKSGNKPLEKILKDVFSTHGIKVDQESLSRFVNAFRATPGGDMSDLSRLLETSREPKLVQNIKHSLYEANAKYGVVRDAASFMGVESPDLSVSGILNAVPALRQAQVDLRLLAYQTEGLVTKTMPKLMAQYEGADELLAIAQRTTQKIGDTTNVYVKLLKSGYKSQKDTMKIVSTSAFMSKRLGMNFEQTAEFANDLHVRLGLSTDEVNLIARGMEQTARQSKLSGEQLMRAAQATRPLLDLMKSAGTLSSTTARNMMDLVASFQKFGVAEQFQGLLQALTSPHAALTASGPMKTLMTIMGGSQGMNAFISGKMRTDKNAMLQGFKNIDRFMSQNMLRHTGVSLEQLTKMTKDELASFLEKHPLLDTQSMQAFGVGIGTLVDGMKSAYEASRPFDQILEDINKKIKTGELSLEQANKQRKDLIMGKGQDILQSFANQLKSSNDSIGESVRKLQGQASFRTSLTEAQKSGELFKGQDLGTQAGVTQAMEDLIRERIQSQNEAVKSAKVDQKYEIDLKKYNLKDKTDVVRVITQLEEARQAVETKRKQDQDPAYSAAASLQTIQNLLASDASGFLGRILDLLGSNVLFNVAAFGAIMANFSGLGIAAVIQKVFSGAGWATRFIQALLRPITTLFKMHMPTGLVSFFGKFFKLARPMGGVFGGLVKAAGKFLWPLQAMMSIFDGVTGAMKAGANAAKIFGVAEDKVTTAQKAAATAAGGFTGILDGFTFGLFTKWLGPDGSITRGLARWFVSLSEKWTKFTEWFQPRWEAVWNWISVRWTKFTEWFQPRWESVWNWLSTRTEEFWSWFQPKIAALWTWLEPVVDFLGNVLLKTIDATVIQIGNQLDWIFSASAALFDVLYKGFQVLGSVSIPDWVVNLFGLRPFATGGVVTQPTLGLIGEAGPEAVIPLDQLNSVIDRLVESDGVQARLQRSRAGVGNTGNAREIATIAELSGTQLSVMREQLEELRQIRSMLNQPGAQASTSSKVKPPTSPNYWRLNYPGYGGNASRNVTAQWI